MVTDAAAPADVLGQSWNELLQQLSELGAITSAVMAVKLTAADCQEIMTECLEGIWQPDWNRQQYGRWSRLAP